MNLSKKFFITLISISLLGLLSCANNSLSLPDPRKVPFDGAVAQLNTPEKVNTWLVKYFKYDYVKLKRNVKAGYFEIDPPQKTYSTRKGVCRDAANFASYCLFKAGYEVSLLRVIFQRRTPSGANGHFICVYKNNGKWWIIADAAPYPVRHIQGPYDTIEKAAKSPSCVRKNGYNWHVEYDIVLQ
jgi:hypothetical protein